jgi:D-arabinose 1-dehydrogenase-like Zn-dependent alcohol dehydrogenase
VQIEILFCGICHSDLHHVRNEWEAIPTTYPCVPGHEIVGRVTKVGPAVTRFKVGDLTAVGPTFAAFPHAETLPQPGERHRSSTEGG